MARNELQKQFEQIVKKVDVQKDALIKRIKAVDHKEAAKDDSVYEAFMPTATGFQEQVSNMMSALYEKNEELGNALIEMFDAIDIESDKLPDEELDEELDEGEDVDDDVDEKLDAISNMGINEVE